MFKQIFAWICFGVATLFLFAQLTDDIPYICCSIPLFISGIVLLRSHKTDKKDVARQVEMKNLPIGNGAFRNAQVYEIQMPTGLKFDPIVSKQMLANLATLLDRPLLRIVATQKSIKWDVIVGQDSKKSSNQVTNTIKSYYPQAIVTSYPYEPPKITGEISRCIYSLDLVNEFLAPIQYIENLTEYDPFVTITQGINSLDSGEQIIYSFYLHDWLPDDDLKAAEKRIKMSFKDHAVHHAAQTLPAIMGEAFGGRAVVIHSNQPRGTGRDNQGIYVEDLQKVLERKLYDEQPLHMVNGFIQIESPDINALLDKVNPALLATVEVATELNGIDIDRSHHLSEEDKWLYPFIISNQEEEWQYSTIGILNDGQSKNAQKRRVPFRTLVLSTAELATLWHLPDKRYTASRINWAKTGQPPPEVLEIEAGTIIGVTETSDQQQKLMIDTSTRQRHMSILGRTGMGKSTLLHTLIQQDIANGHGIAFLDPLGKEVQKILRGSIPKERENDVIVLDIQDFNYPPPFNPLVSYEGDEDALSLEVIGILEQLETNLPPIVSDTLNAAFITLLNKKPLTVRDVTKLLNREEYRYKFLQSIRHTVTREYWEFFESLSPSEKTRRISTANHRLRKFYRNPRMELMMCHPQPINLQKVITEKKILLVSVAMKNNFTEEDQRLLGLSFVSQFLTAVKTLGHDNSRDPFYLFIDEAQDFTNAPLDKIFSQMRQYGIGLTIANQHLKQLSEETLAAVIGNAGMTAAFQMADDAKRLSPYMQPVFSETDLTNLDQYEFAIRTAVGTKEVRYRAKTITPPDYEGENYNQREAYLRELSRKNYTPMSREDIQHWFDEEYPPFFKAPDENQEIRGEEWGEKLEDDNEKN